MWTIYLLLDPERPTGYVGQTRRRLAHRVRQHITAAARNTSESRSTKARWLQDIAARGLAPTVVTLAQCTTSDEANASEAGWLAYLRDVMALETVNSTAGGQGVYPADHGAKVSAALQRPATKARKSRASKMVAEKTWSDSAIAERRTAGMKRSWTEERRAKMKALWADPVHRANRLAAQKAAFARPEIIAKLRQQNGDRARSSEHRLRVSRQATAQWGDPVKRAQISQSMSVAADREKLSKRSKEMWSDPVKKKAIVAKITEANRQPLARANHSARMTAIWAERRARVQN